MNKHFLNLALWMLSPAIFCVIGCSDNTTYPDVDGKDPVATLKTTHIQSGAGHDFTIEGTLTDADGITSIKLDCADLNLNKVINLLDIYGEPKTSYDLKYKFSIQPDEIGEQFTIKVTVFDVGGRFTSQDILVTMDGDFEDPKFTIVPKGKVTVLVKSEPKYNLNFIVTDDRGLDYVTVDIQGVNDFEHKSIDADSSNPTTLQVSEVIALPGDVVDEYPVTITAVDLQGNQTSSEFTISVSEMPDFEKMYLADVTTVEELNSDIFGVPMVINHTGEYEYTAYYYNKTAGKGIFFLPQKTDFTPICFGLDPEDNSKLTDDPLLSKPIVLEEAGVYYEIKINVKEYSYNIVRTYTPSQATDPLPDRYSDHYGELVFALWDDQEAPAPNANFYIGWGTSPKNVDTDKTFFAQDPNNKHLYYYPADGQSWSLSEGTKLENLVITNPHPHDWWDRVSWRNDDGAERFGYYNKSAQNAYGIEGYYVNQYWVEDGNANMTFDDGSPVTDIKFDIEVLKTGNYRFEFDAHLGRGKIVPVN